MERTLSVLVPICLLASLPLVLGSAATHPGPAQATCIAENTWLPNTPQSTFDAPPAHPAPDCPFYKSAWQNFLYSTQPDSNGQPRFLTSYKTLRDVFGPSIAPQFPKTSGKILSLAPRTIQFENDNDPRLDAGVKQAGPLRGLLIDQNGNPIYYAIHVNDVYANFVNDNGLTTPAAIKSADPDKIQFVRGAIELKSAWQIVDSKSPPKNYFTVKASVPNLHIMGADIVPDGTTRTVTVALIAIHVVFILDQHPEFIWSTFEHVGEGGQGIRDNAPVASANPDALPATRAISNATWTLYKAGTLPPMANIPNPAQDRVMSFDEQTQTFTKNGMTLQSSVYRAYPASKSDTTTEDSDVVGVNQSMSQLLLTHPLPDADKRNNYQLVGAIWLDNPSRDFRSNAFFENEPGQTTDTPDAMVAGEDGLSSTAMESFTQTGDQSNCFSCHNTRRVTDDNTGKKILDPKRLNVSHVLSKFLSEEPNPTP